MKQDTGKDYKLYHRSQCYTDLPMDKSDEETINGLIETGKKLYEEENKKSGGGFFGTAKEEDK